ncbi:tetratricopeptide repeat protein [Neptunicoccus cionae]|uniref:tetratricopeptide repeat protein n=1 Tax=Neptunicoccus cionae TaxID=2035344 RepID=UPI001E414DB2|nr:tetratricopeptide repeat protein [Amylibacter cionae]
MAGKSRKFAIAFGFVAALGASLVMPQTPQAQGLAGAYLAGNQANRDNNYEQAARFYSEALARDPGNPYLLQNALLSFVAKGDVQRSIAIARKIQSGQFASQLADLVVMAQSIREGDFSEAEAILDDSADIFSPLLTGLLSGWVALGDGQMTVATKRFDGMANPPAMRLFGQYHKALALAAVGDFATADKILTGDEDGNLRLNRGSLIAHAQIMTQLDRKDEALALLDGALRGTSDQGVSDLRDRIAEQGVVPYDFITEASQGAAEVFLTLASVLEREQDERYALVYARLAEYLRPGYTEAILLTAEILQDQDQFELASKTYARVTQDDPMFLNAELGRADALVEAGKHDAAIEVLRNMTRTYGDVPRVHISLGDVLRGQEEYAEAATAYDTAVEMIPDPAPNHWFLFYARGISYEREGQWEQAEADFRRALELSPNQPLVLNYLGYSLVEANLKLEEAQDMIEQAVKARPEDGYITDSLGWVLYRIGKYEEAVAPMERAVELVSNDPIINDHLGDVYWKVNRKREAEFQWSRALSLKPEEKDASRIRRKLEVGLDTVLEEEGTAEKTAAGNDN